MTPYIRNDDPSYDTDFDNFKGFCEICDKYRARIIQAITPLGITHTIESAMSDEEIVALGGKHTLLDNERVINLLKERAGKDIYAVHGLWHSHAPSENDVAISKHILKSWGLFPDYFVLPFNEGTYDKSVLGLEVLGKMQRLEDYLPGMPKENDIPTDPVVYLHEWRFAPGNSFGYSLDKLDQCLKRITDMTSKL